MTVEEKRKKLKEYCARTACYCCPLHKRFEKIGGCFSTISDEDVNKNYEIVFGNTKTDRHVEVIAPEDVIPCLLDGDKVIRINLEKMVCCDLRDKSINTIKNDLQKDCYVYLVVDTYDIVNVEAIV